MAPLLELKDVSARYGQVAALHSVSLTVDEGEIVALLGANGAGKTTTLRAVSGTVRRNGDVVFAGKRLGRSGPEGTARAGIAHVPEGRGIFAELSVWDNLRMGAYMRRGRPDFTTVLAYFPWLESRRHQQAGTLSGGEQQMLALARALLMRPHLMLLDEPSLGLAPLVVKSLFDIIRDINHTDHVGVLLVEQNARLALELSTHAYVLEVGRVAVSGLSADLKGDDSVRRSYLGY
jgi:branched-chain amino acid transport system ATP-binding protein